jgi:signal-transduction protein with cAMP-binding, CBS, and nucleotidyltransferase domain
MKVREVMTKSVESVAPDSDLVAVARKMKELNVGSIPVMESDRLMGIITDRDIVVRAIAEGKNCQGEPVRNHLTPNPTTVTPDTDVKEAADIMAREQIRRLPVVESGKLVGFLAIGDLAVDAGRDRMVGDALEQISEPAKPRTGGAGR